MLSRVLRALRPTQTVHAHCDIPCGVYDPQQARIEAESCYKIIQKYADSTDDVFRARCLVVKEERAELTKHHIDVMWHDYFKPEHVEKFPDLHDICWKASKQASGQAHGRHRRGAEAPRPDRQDRHDVARDRRADCHADGQTGLNPGRQPMRRLIRSWRARVAVTGHSMEPTLRDGDWLLVDPDAYRRRPPTAGELVVADDPRTTGRLIVKRVRTTEAGESLVVCGDHAAHADERVRLQSATVRGRPAFRYWPLRRFGRVS